MLLLLLPCVKLKQSLSTKYGSESELEEEDGVVSDSGASDDEDVVKVLRGLKGERGVL